LVSKKPHLSLAVPWREDGSFFDKWVKDQSTQEMGYFLAFCLLKKARRRMNQGDGYSKNANTKGLNGQFYNKFFSFCKTKNIEKFLRFLA
jgi:hypothetical protein